MTAIAEFTQKLHENPELLARVQAAEPGERHALLEESGIEVTPELQEQAKAAVQRLGIDPTDADSWAEVELSDDELTELTGGTGNVTQVALTFATSAGGAAGGGSVGTAMKITIAAVFG